MRSETVYMFSSSSFFFQAEDGIRDDLVTGVQTCALPIYREITRVLSRAHEFAIDVDLSRLNESYCVVNMEGKTVVMCWKISEINAGELVPYFMPFDDFKRFQMKYRKTETIIDGKGNPQNKTVGMGEWWINHQNRRQYDGIKYAPFSEQEVIDGCLNL